VTFQANVGGLPVTVYLGSLRPKGTKLGYVLVQPLQWDSSSQPGGLVPGVGRACAGETTGTFIRRTTTPSNLIDSPPPLP
jgi:hypothetical protein